MKKFILFLTIVTSVCLVCGFAGSFKKVHAEENVAQTEIVLPSSYLEYFSLSAPVDICFDGVNFAVAENKRIAIFMSDTWKTYDLSDYSVSKISLYENFCLFLSSSELFYFPIGSGEIKKANVILSNYFYVSGNQLVTTPSTSIYKYTLKIDNGELTFVEPTFYDGLSFSVDKFVTTSDGSFYYFLEQKIYRFNYLDRTSTEFGKNLLSTPRYTVAYDKVIYYSSDTGIYSFNLETKVNELIIGVSNGDSLPAIANPQGIYYHNGNLLVADSRLNSVLSIDVKTKTFTDFAITTRSDMPSRINNANDIAGYGDEVFILESNAIKVYNTANDTNYEYSLTSFSGAKYMAVSSEYIFLSQGAQFYIVKYDGEKLQQVSLDNSVDIDEYKNIVAVISYEEDFYFIDNQSRNSVMKACIYKLSTNNMTVTEIGAINGAGQRLCSDIFGKVYIAVNNNSEYCYYSFVPSSFEETLSSTPLFTTAEKPLSMFVDIEDKIYILFDNMILRCFEQSFTPPYDFILHSEYTIKLSENLPSGTTVKLAELLPATSNLYLLSDNVLFAVTSDLGIATPNKLKVPENLRIELNMSPEFVTVNKASKIFKVDIEDTNKEYFDYIEYTTELSDDQYIVLNKGERYYLIFNQKTCALVRSFDVAPYTPPEVSNSNQYFMVDNYGLYTHPTTRPLFKIDTLNKNDKVTLIKTITFNEVNYCYVASPIGEGYVPESTLKQAIATDNTPTSFYTIKIAKKGAKVYSDKQLKNEIGFLDGEVIVTAVESVDGVTKIYYDGGYAYISNDSIKPSTYYSIRNIIVIACLFIGVLATLLFIFKAKVFDKKE